MEYYFTLNMGDGDHAPRNPTTYILLRLQARGYTLLIHQWHCLDQNELPVDVQSLNMNKFFNTYN